MISSETYRLKYEAEQRRLEEEFLRRIAAKRYARCRQVETPLPLFTEPAARSRGRNSGERRETTRNHGQEFSHGT